MRTHLYACELPKLIAMHEKDASKIFMSKKEKEWHKSVANKMRSSLLERFPELNGMPFDEWESRILDKEHTSGERDEYSPTRNAFVGKSSLYGKDEQEECEERE